MHSFGNNFVWLGEAFKSPQRGDRLISRIHGLIKARHSRQSRQRRGHGVKTARQKIAKGRRNDGIKQSKQASALVATVRITVRHEK
jgi:hypothetical protein